MCIAYPQDKELSYAKVALAEYNILSEEIKRNTKIDPNYAPEIKVKKIIDEKEMSPLVID
jgi:hypothetical protein